MSNSLIITIGREYGSGGRQIGEIVAKTLGINFYGKNLITLSAQKSGLSDEFIANNEQRVRSGWMQNLAASAAYSNGFFSVSICRCRNPSSFPKRRSSAISLPRRVPSSSDAVPTTSLPAAKTPSMSLSMRRRRCALSASWSCIT